MSTVRDHATCPGPAVPTKCATCEALMQVPLACEDCHQLLAQVQGADYFELFGLPQQYDLDVALLEERYLAISRNIHPDRYATAGAEMQAFALRASAAVNRALEVLRDPLHRAAYLLESVGGKPATQDKRVPPELLPLVMALREEIEEARFAGDQRAFQSLRGRITEQTRAIEQRIAELCRDLTTAPPQVKDELRLRLNAMKYYNNLLMQL